MVQKLFVDECIDLALSYTEILPFPLSQTEFQSSGSMLEMIANEDK